MDLILFLVILLAFYALVSLRVLKQYEREVTMLRVEMGSPTSGPASGPSGGGGGTTYP